jgi:hypothetical protein
LKRSQPTARARCSGGVRDEKRPAPLCSTKAWGSRGEAIGSLRQPPNRLRSGVRENCGLGSPKGIPHTYTSGNRIIRKTSGQLGCRELLCDWEQGCCGGSVPSQIARTFRGLSGSQRLGPDESATPRAERCRTSPFFGGVEADPAQSGFLSPFPFSRSLPLSPPLPAT